MPSRRSEREEMNDREWVAAFNDEVPPRRQARKKERKEKKPELAEGPSTGPPSTPPAMQSGMYPSPPPFIYHDIHA